MSKATLLDHFSALDDPRQSGKVLYPLPEILPLVLRAIRTEDFKRDAVRMALTSGLPRKKLASDLGVRA